MKKFSGSYSVEAAFIMPLILGSIYIAILSGISMHEEVLQQVEAQAQRKPFDMVKGMYHRALVKELFGELYED